jgi:hypothetical protein
LVLKQVASLHELQTVYSFDDCLKLNALLDMQEDIEAIMHEDLEKKQKYGNP